MEQKSPLFEFSLCHMLAVCRTLALWLCDLTSVIQK